MRHAKPDEPVTTVISMVLVTCASCSVPFGVPSELQDRRRKDGKDFHCPNGHPNVYNNTETDRLKKEAADQKARADKAEKDLAAERKAHASTRASLEEVVEATNPSPEDDVHDDEAAEPLNQRVLTVLGAIPEGLSLDGIVAALGDEPKRVSASLSHFHTLGVVVRVDEPGRDEVLFRLNPSPPVPPYQGTVEARILAYLADKPEGVNHVKIAWDIGANVGTVSATLSTLTRRRKKLERVASGIYRLRPPPTPTPEA